MARPKFDPELMSVLELGSEFEEWRALAAEWLKSSRKSPYRRYRSIVLFIKEYLHNNIPNKSPRYLLEEGNEIPEFIHAVSMGLTEPVMKNHGVDVYEFINWILKEKSHIEKASGQHINPQNLRNPFQRPRKPLLGKLADVEFKYLLLLDPALEAWRNLAATWLSEQRHATDSKRHALDKFLVAYIHECKQETNPLDFLRRQSLRRSFYDAILSSKVNDEMQGLRRQGTFERVALMHTYVHNFIEWVLLKKFAAEDDYGRLVVPPELENPIPILEGKSLKRTESNKSPLPFRFVRRLRGMIAEGPTFRDWKWAQNSDGGRVNGGDWYVVSPDVIDKDDPDCVWRSRETTKMQRDRRNDPEIVYEMWSPVRAVALYIKLELPLRTYQVQMLDSGEADTWRYTSDGFVRNSAALAIGDERRPYQRGVFRRSANGEFGGMYVNTNKTADIHKDEAEKGYTIPWENRPVLDCLEKLRNWQERYNPITKPSSWLDLKVKHFGRTRPHASVLAERGDICFLFRDSRANGEDRRLAFPASALDRLWFKLLSELEERCVIAGETTSDGGRLRFVEPESNTLVTLYPLHALRVSLITAFALEGGVPLPILSKLIAGHASVIMTLYYTKASRAYVTEVMEEAEKNILASEGNSYKRFLLEQSASAIEKAFAFSELDAVRVCKQQDSAVGFVIDDKGICPVGSALCNIGGELVSGKNEGTAPVKYGPVSGYPEERNCIRCRFFLTGPGFLGGLVAKFNEISYRTSLCTKALLSVQQEVNDLEDLRVLAERDGKLFLKSNELEKASQRHETQSETANKLMTDLQFCTRLIDRCIAILNAKGDDGIRLVATGEISDIRYALAETTSEMHQLQVICESAVVYPEINAEIAVLRRSQLLDAMLQMNDKPPMFFKLTAEQQLNVGNEVMKLIAARAGSRRDAVEFTEGRRALQELGLLDEAMNVIGASGPALNLGKVVGEARNARVLAEER